jgi:hypothetical protein
MSTGGLPFRGESSGVIFNAILERPAVSPLPLNPDLPPKLEEITNKALDKHRNLRHQHASEIHTDLQRLKRDTDTGKSTAISGTAVSPPTISTILDCHPNALCAVIFCIGCTVRRGVRTPNSEPPRRSFAAPNIHKRR